MLRHGTHCPKEFTFYYDSVESLLEFANNHVKNEIVPYGPRLSHVVYKAAHTLELAETMFGYDNPLMTDIREALGKKELEENEVIVSYHGARKKNIIFICNAEYFFNKLLHNSISLSTDKDGYIQLVKECRPMHLDVMKRGRALDGKVVDHSTGVRVDNRVRNLRIVPRWFNNMNRRTVKGYFQRGNLWYVSININDKFRRPPFDTERKAQLGREYLVANIFKVRKMLKGSEMNDRELANYIARELKL
jgi:hypothetical protein